jgi:hypothetical protein
MVAACSPELSEEISMAAGSFEPQFIFRILADQYPVWLNVAVPPAFPVPFQGMVPILRGQRLPTQQNLDKLNQLLLILPLLDQALDVLLELSRL